MMAASFKDVETEQEKKKNGQVSKAVFSLLLQKLQDHPDKHPAYSYAEAARMFDPDQLQ